MLRRLLFGLLKGIVVGGALGALLHFGLGWTSLTGWLGYVIYGAAVALGGVVAGQPPWRKGAWIASILKGLFGFGVGAGLYALATHFLKLPVGGLVGIPTGTVLAESPLFFAPLVTLIYTTLVELDDGGPAPAAESGGVRVASGASTDLDALLSERQERSSTKAGRS